MIDLVYILSFSFFYADETLDLLSTSSKHFVISELTMVSGDQNEDLKQKLTELLNNSSLHSMVTISSCTEAIMSTDPSKLKFKHIDVLELENCTFVKRGTTFLELQSVE
jgi:hypothetical protein